MVLIDGFVLNYNPSGLKSFLVSLLQALNSKELPAGYFKLVIPDGDDDVIFRNVEVANFVKSLGASIDIEYIRISPFFYFFRKYIKTSGPVARLHLLFIWERYYIPYLVKKFNPHVVFHPYQAIYNYQTRAKKVVVIHDTILWNEKEKSSIIIEFINKIYKTGCKNADHIITISETSKKQILDTFAITTECVTVCYEGVNDIFMKFTPSPEKKQEIVSNYTLPSKYIFGIVSHGKYKNSFGILKVFEQLMEKDSDLKLVLIGRRLADPNHEINIYIKEKKLNDKVVKIVKDNGSEEMAYFYNLSYVTLYLSYNEGFGLPPLEALCCNTLPITSDLGALAEIYGNVIPTFDPNDYDQIAEFIDKLKNDDRDKIIKFAREKLLKKYSWDNIIDLYLPYLK